jgi:multiple sugar transport system permease protein
LKKLTPSALAINIALIALLLWIIFPLFWALIDSFKSDIDIFRYPPSVLFTPGFDAYGAVLSGDWLGYFRNSIVVAFGGVILPIVIGLPGAYALARYDLPRKNFTMLSILSIRMMPGIVMLIPYFLMFLFLHLLDTYIGLILVYTLFNLPYVVWIMRGFIEQIPRAMEEAAELDGASLRQIFFEIMIPLSRVGLVITGFLCFALAWNDFAFAFILTDLNRTVPVGLSSLIGSREVFWNQIFAVGAINMIPAMVFAYWSRKYWVRGFTLGIVKG